MIDDDAVGVHGFVAKDGDGSLSAAEFVDVGQVDDDRHLAGLGDAQLGDEGFFLVRRDVVESDFAEGHTARMIEVGWQAGDDLVGEAVVFRFLGVEGNGGEVIDAEAAGTDGFEFEDEIEVIEEGSGVAAIGAQPEGWFNASPDSGIVHGLIVIGGAGIHVDVWLDDLHEWSFA